MNANQWEKVRHNWTELLKAYTSSTLAYLYQEGVINDDDRENINTARTSSQKMETLLFIIKRKIGKDPYRHLITILKEESPHLAEEIESTASSSQPNLNDPGNVLADSEEVRKVLRDHFTDGDEQNPVSLGEIRDTLKKEKAFSKGNEWSNQMLKDYLEKEFLNVEFQTSASSSRNNKRIVVKHIKRLSGEMQADQILKPTVVAKSDQDVDDDIKPLYEHPRRFGADVDVTTKYVKGRCFDDVSSHVRGKKTTPIRNYHLVNQSQGQDEMLEFIGCTLIPFVSACMNERKNGTLYFGVCPKKDDKYRAGEVVGVTIDKDEVGKEIDNRLQTSFLNEQTKYTKVVRHPKFIPVVSGSSSTASWVVEIDVEPSSSILNNEVIRTKLHFLKMFLTRKKKQNKEYGIFRFSDDGIPRVLPEPEDIEFNRNIFDLVQQRNQDEGMPITKTPKFFNKLNQLLTGGTKQGTVLDERYIFLMLSPIDTHMDSTYLNENMSFIKNLEPDVVFDFDPNGFAQGVYHTLDATEEEIFNVYTLDMFDNTKDNFKILLERLTKDNYTQWVFCNGHDNMETFDKRTWNKIRKLQFQEAIRAFADNYGKERIILIMCLFSKNYELMISACEEAITRLSNQWILLAENEDIAKLWQDKMSEDKLEKKELEYNSVLDMTWDQISMTVSQVKEKTKNTDVFLTCSNGSMTPVPTKKIKEWHDVDILTAGDFILEKNEEELEVELKFYQGKQVRWLNFWFHNQVLQRDIHSNLKQAVEDSLEGKTQDEYRVQYVTLWHQPGAGGTTAAMHVLWDLRTKYRCCRVLNITEETSEHLEEIWHFKEDTKARSPKPLLVLIDYVDDDEYIKFKGKLEELGRKNRRHYEESFDVFCTIIECKRSTRPLKESNKIGLLHNLTERESRWFNKKNEKLKTKIQTQFLFAFNIMREKFSQKYISDVVKEFCNALHEKLETDLLLIVSFLNEYDLTFKPIKISWLDCFFKNRNSPGVKETISFMRDVKWEANLSPGIKLLMNISNYSRHNSKPRKYLRIINKLLAKEILKSMQLITKKKTSEIMLELCDQKVYNQTGQDANDFRYLINCIAKKREVAENRKKCKFSPFVTDVIDKEGAEVAVDVLDKLFEVSQDAFIAQLISRVYMEMKNWNKAKFYAQRATYLKPENSYLWDTFGRVFNSQLTECNTDNNAKHGTTEEEIIKIIKIASEGLAIFQKAQDVSENEMTTLEENNIAGYFGELRTILLVLNALRSHPAFKEHSKLHRYLIELNYCPAELAFLQDYKYFLKSLGSRARLGMRRLDEEYVQVKSGSGQEERINDDFSKNSLIKLKANLDCFFEETQMKYVPTTLTDREACAYRLSVAQSKGASSLNQILELRKKGKLQDIIDCANLLLENIKSPFVTFFDFKAFLDVLTVLIANNNSPPGLKFQKILDWSKTFYYLDQPKESSRYYLEPMMYFVLYNFPTEERIASNLCTITDLKIAMEKWRDQFKKNYPKQDIFILRKRETTLFFLGNGSPLQDIVPQDHLEIMNKHNYIEKWNLPEIRKRLRMMTGVLSDDGEKVKTVLTTKDGNNITLDILTAYPVNKRMMWNKRVYFYLGFSFSGPKAFGMSLEELGTCRT